MLRCESLRGGERACHDRRAAVTVIALTLLGLPVAQLGRLCLRSCLARQFDATALELDGSS